MPNYKIGNDDPPLKHDRGAGIWKSEPTHPETKDIKDWILRILPSAHVTIGRDAAKHLNHYFENTGKDYTIDLKGLLDTVPGDIELENPAEFYPGGKRLYNRELDEAKIFVKSLNRIGRFEITSQVARVGRIYPRESWNWYYAVGGYSSWGKGTATVTGITNGRKLCKLDFEYKFFDRYNWDGGKRVFIYGVEITDEAMGQFHREGLAKEFNMYGSYKETVEWVDLPIRGRSPSISKFVK
jgi:hypothetical protein